MIWDTQEVIVAKLRSWHADDLDNIPLQGPVNLMRNAADEIERLQKQCEDLAQSAMNNGQGLLLLESSQRRALELLREAVQWVPHSFEGTHPAHLSSLRDEIIEFLEKVEK